MKIHCPNCESPIPAAQMNVPADVAVCQRCDEAFSISRIVRGEAEDPVVLGGVADDFDLHQPPRGASFDQQGMGWQLTATLRSGLAFFLVPFMAIWSGGSIGGIYGSQIAKGEFDLALSLFGIPFLLGTIILGSATLMSLLGKIAFSADEMDQDRGRIFVGCGPFGWTRRFRWSEVEAIEESYSSMNSNNQRYRQIMLRCPDKDISTGSMLSDVRRRYLLQALRQLVLQRR